MSVVRLENIKKSYTVGENVIDVLNGITLNVEEGDLIAIMGASGSGKSTTMNIVGLLDKPTSGTYYLDGEDVSKLTSDERARIRNKKIGFVFQSFFLLPRLTALQNVGLPLIYRGMHRQEINKKAQEMLDKVDVGELAKNKPSEMSGGQQQRVAIARALVGDPEFILADEPTGALDSKTGDAVMNLMIELNREGKTVVIITHDEEVAERCERVVRVVDGLLVD